MKTAKKGNEIVFSILKYKLYITFEETKKNSKIIKETIYWLKQFNFNVYKSVVLLVYM